MIDPVSSTCFPCGEIPRYKKKSQKKTPKKANHRHEYSPVILSYIDKYSDFSRERGFVPMRVYSAGSRCTVCGRLIHGFPGSEPTRVARTVKIPWVNGTERRYCEVLEDFKHLPVVEVTDYWTLKEEKTYG